jgi:hypothetical protein
MKFLYLPAFCWAIWDQVRAASSLVLFTGRFLELYNRAARVFVLKIPLEYRTLTASEQPILSRHLV